MNLLKNIITIKNSNNALFFTLLLPINLLLFTSLNCLSTEEIMTEKEFLPNSSTSTIPSNNPTPTLSEDNEPFALFEYAEAVILLRAAEYHQAAQKFDHVIRIHPNLHKAYIGRALALSHINQLPAALKDIEKALELVPNYAATYNARGVIHANNQSAQLAIFDFQKAISIDPEYPEPYENLGFLYYKLGNLINAKINLEKAMSLYQKMNNTQKTQSLLETLSKLNP